MNQSGKTLAQGFEENRSHLRAVAYRILGSPAEADDAVQEAWLKVSRSDIEEIENLKGWLTTVVSRVCLDQLRSRKARKEESPLEDRTPSSDDAGPETDLLLADSVGPALLAVMDTLNPAERVAFVLHDLFDLTFDEIAPIVGRSDVATRQLASRARRRVKGAPNQASAAASSPSAREIVSAFLAASRGGDFSALLQVLDPDVVLRADPTAIQVSRANRDKGAPQFENETRGAKAVAELLKGRAAAAELVLLDGEPGAAWAPRGGKPVVAFLFTVKNGRVSEIGVMMNAQDLGELEIRAIG